MATDTITRNELVTILAIERAEYELMVERYGYSPAATAQAKQPMAAFVHSSACRLARLSSRKVAGIQVSADRGCTYARIDWRKLAARVEATTPSWRATILRCAHEDALTEAAERAASADELAA